jgi:transposase
VTLQLRLSRWRCRNIECRRKTFVEQMPEVFPPLARRTRRVAELVHLFGHSAGGKPGERLMGRLGAPVSDDTILRHLKRRVADRNATTPVRVAGIDDWSWRKGSTYGAIVVDLERREVVDVLPDRSAAATANWLRGRPEVEVVSRDRCGLFAQGAREGAPQARQVADRFHLLQNFRQAIERQLSRAGRSTGRPLVAASSEDENGASCFCSPSGQRQVAEHKHLVRHAHRRSRQESFDQIRDLHKEGMTLREIAQRTGFHWRSIAKWVQLSAPAERTAIAPKPSSPNYFLDYLRRRWEAGCIVGRHLFDEIKRRGYVGSFSNLERLLAKWRRIAADAPPATVMPTVQAVDPTTGWLISPIVAAALCIKPRASLNPEQAAKIEALKGASADFVVMRQLAMRLRGLFRSKSDVKLDAWLEDAHRSGLYAMQCFVRTLRQDIDAVRNALTECWSNGQTEGQINRLKTLKRAMYGRAGAELIRARMLPAPLHFQHAL